MNSVVAFLAINSGIYLVGPGILGGVIGSYISVSLGGASYFAFGLVLHFGWPLLAVLCLKGNASHVCRRARLKAILALLYLISTMFVGIAISPIVVDELVEIAYTVCTLPATIAFVGLPAFCAKTLVEVEEKRPVPLSRCLRTYFQFFFFSQFGVLLLQERIQEAFFRRQPGE